MANATYLLSYSILYLTSLTSLWVERKVDAGNLPLSDADGIDFRSSCVHILVATELILNIALA